MNKTPKKIEQVIFARVGHSVFYGSTGELVRPLGGGAYNQTETGHEAYNFCPHKGRVYGYFQPQMRSNELNLRRLGAKNGAKYLDNCIVIWIARGRIVGWYRDARVFSMAQDPDAELSSNRNNFKYYCVAPRNQAVLLPTASRAFPIAQNKKGAFGRSNIRYPSDQYCQPAFKPWMKSALQWIESYIGDNLLEDPNAEAGEDIKLVIAGLLAKEPGQGMMPNSAARKAVEERAMFLAEQHYKKRYNVLRQGKPYDLCCKPKNDKKNLLYVEVKGSTLPLTKIILTKNEVAFNKKRQSNMALYLVESIKLQKRGKGYVASGGEQREVLPFNIKTEKLQSICYWYQL